MKFTIHNSKFTIGLTMLDFREKVKDVYKHRTMEDKNRLDEEWAVLNFQAFREKRRNLFQNKTDRSS